MASFLTTSLVAAAVAFAAVPAVADEPSPSPAAAPAASPAPVASPAADASPLAAQPPVRTGPPHGYGGAPPFAPARFTYTLDGSVASGFGNTGNGTALPGGIDAALAYQLAPRLRLGASYFDFPVGPAGLSQGIVPLYGPRGQRLGSADLSRTGPRIDAQNEVALVNLTYALPVSKWRRLLITPTYITRTASVNQTGNDFVTVLVRGKPQTVQLRTAQVKAIGFTFPAVVSREWSVNFSAAPSWLMHANGANIDNHPQLNQTVYVEYRPFRETRFFVQGQSVREYLPAYSYAQHLNGMRYGASRSFGGKYFVELNGIAASASNGGRFGIDHLTCVQLPCGRPVPTIGGLHAATVQLKFGIGTPLVIAL